jgi:hypothetical protein
MDRRSQLSSPPGTKCNRPSEERKADDLRCLNSASRCVLDTFSCLINGTIHGVFLKNSSCSSRVFPLVSLLFSTPGTIQ